MKLAGNRWCFLAFGCLAALGATVRAVDYPIVIQRGDGLANTFARLNSGQSAKIAYIGGSVTQSPGWRDNVTAWFASKHPGRITEVNAGWGGTGSLIGAMRLARDVLVHHPDLIFIEFAVNDLPEDPLAFVQRNSEGMIRQAWAQAQGIDICFVETIAWYSEGPYLAGYYPTPVQAHYDVADYYGCPSVNVGWALYEHVLAGTPWTDLAPDRVHPNTAGSAVYSDAVIGYLESERVRGAAAQAHAIPPALTSFPVMSGTIRDAATISPLPPAWSVHTNEFGVPSFIQSSTAGATVSCSFTGPAAACKIIIAPDSGNLSYSVDGGAFASANVPIPGGAAPWAFPVAKMLSAGTHNLALRVEGGIARIINVESANTAEACGPGPGDVDLARGATVQADSIYGSNWGPERAIDGSLATKWTSTATAPTHWLALDFGRMMSVSFITVLHAGAGGEPAYYNTQAFTIDVAEDPAGPWTTSLTGINSTQADSSTFCVSPALKTRYLRLHITDAGIDNYARIPELEIWGSPAICRSDFDRDNDVDQSDFGLFQACLSGPGIAQSQPTCQDMKLDDDSDVDDQDLALWLVCQTGPDHPPPAACY